MENPVSTESQPAPLPDLVRRLVSGGVWVVAGRISGVGLTFLANMLLARWWLAPEPFGQFLLVLSIISMLCILARGGLDRFLIRYIPAGLARRDVGLVGGVLRLSFLTGLTVSVAVSMLAFGLLAALHGTLQLPVPILWIIAGAVPVFTMLYLTAESFRGFHQLRLASLFQPHAGPLTTALFLLALFAVMGVFPSLFAALTCYLVSAALVLPAAAACLAGTARRQLAGASLTREDESQRFSLKQLLSFCAPIAVSDTLGFLTINAGLWIVAVCCSGEDLARFGAARQLQLLAGLPLHLVNLTVISSIPELHAGGHRRRLQRMLRVAASVALLPTLLMLLTFVIAGEPILGAIFGMFYRDARWILVILVAGQLVSTWTGGCVNTLLLTGWQTLVARLNLAFMVVLLGLGTAAASSGGAVGVAVVSAAVMAGFNLLAWLLVRIKLGVWTHATWRLPAGIPG
jgi:O-antigen/teichoic acid export membrane protein